MEQTAEVSEQRAKENNLAIVNTKLWQFPYKAVGAILPVK